MKAMVYHGRDEEAWEDVPDAPIQKPTDVVVKVETTTICGTDLQIFKRRCAGSAGGRILGTKGSARSLRLARRSLRCRSAIGVILACNSAVWALRHVQATGFLPLPR